MLVIIALDRAEWGWAHVLGKSQLHNRDLFLKLKLRNGGRREKGRERMKQGKEWMKEEIEGEGK